jgi:CMP-N,N'-diacetyllegionaminic acid synthase
LAKNRLNIVTVIPARGGSKSIPKKNIQLLNGKPLVQYSIDYSLKSSLTTDTVVSTDSKEIAKISRQCGAKVPFLRPKEFAEDDTPDYPVIKHALDTLERLNNNIIDVIILLRPTSPLRPPNLIEMGIDLLKRFPKATSVRSVTKTKEHPFRQWQKNENYIRGFEKSIEEPYNLPRQKLPEIYFQTGDIEIIKRNTLILGSISGENVLPLLIDHSSMLDIDEISDLEVANKKIN